MIKPPQGYRILSVGDIVKEDDLYYIVDWCLTANADRPVLQDGWGRYARKIKYVPEPEMPIIDLVLLHQVLSPGQYSYVRCIVDPGTSRLRLTRQCSSNVHAQHATYVWAKVVSYISPLEKHYNPKRQPFFYLSAALPDLEIKRVVKELDYIVAIILQTVPANLWHGVKYWRNEV